MMPNGECQIISPDRSHIFDAGVNFLTRVTNVKTLNVLIFVETSEYLDTTALAWSIMGPFDLFEPSHWREIASTKSAS